MGVKRYAPWSRVDDLGLVTGAAEGEADITATSSGVTGRAQVTVVAPVPPTERDILVALYRATDGPNWVNSDNWLTDAPLRSWYGVVVNGERRLVKIDLARNNLSGPIPPELGELANLTSLSLVPNNLSGPIPPELGELANLTSLSLGPNNLSGPIPPELGELANLASLSLVGNNLSGPIPPEFGGLANLASLSLGGNNLSGPIPPEFGGLSSLKTLDLWNSELTGPIPPELGNLSSLQRLYLDENALTGPIPPEPIMSNLTDCESTNYVKSMWPCTI